MQLKYRYTMKLEFSQPVTDQYFSVMCIPGDTERQKCIENIISIQPETTAATDEDGLGNRFVYGVIRDPHSSFCLVSEGVAETGNALHEEYEEPGGIELVRYKVQSSYTLPGPELKALYSEWAKSWSRKGLFRGSGSMIVILPIKKMANDGKCILSRQGFPMAKQENWFESI